MKSLGAFVLCCIVLQFFEPGQALKCRSGNRQADERYQKILQVCRKRNSSGNGNNDDSYSNDSNDSSSDSNSNEDIFHERFFARNNDTHRDNWRSDNRNDRYHNENDQQTRRSNGDSYSYSSNRGNSGDASGGGRTSSNGRGSANSNRQSYGNNRANTRTDGNNNSGGEEAVDRKGFPEMESVIRLMEENVQNPDVRDFIEESVTECFHYVNSNFRRDKCDFSQRLLSCMADKGKERCEDWDD